MQIKKCWQSSLTARRAGSVLILILPLFILPTPRLEAAPKKMLIQFSPESYRVNVKQAELLNRLAVVLKSNPHYVVEIDDRSQAYAHDSFEAAVEKDRSLGLFLILTRAGVDPARVQLKTSSLADERKNALEMSVDQNPQAPSTLFLTSSPVARTKPSLPSEGLTLAFRDGLIDSTAIDEQTWNAFLSLLGRDDHDALQIDIPAKTADDSSALQVRAVQDRNANLAYEFLLRKGVPAYRIKALPHETVQGNGPESATTSADAVRMQWRKDPVIAALAEKEMAGVSPSAAEELLTDSDWQIPIPADPKLGEETVAQVLGEEKTATKSETIKIGKSAKAQRGFASGFDILSFLDYLMPGGELKDHAKPGSWFGLGVSTNLKTTGIYEIRGNLLASFNASLKSREDDRRGDLHLHYQALRFDFLWGKLHGFRPYLSLALASYTSKADIDRPSTSVRNSRSRNDFGAAYTAGYECPVVSQFFVSPELTYHRVGGDFDESLLSLGLSLRYRI